MSTKLCSLAVEEEKDQSLINEEQDFEPELKVLINKRWKKDSHSLTDKKPVKIGGRIIVSF